MGVPFIIMESQVNRSHTLRDGPRKRDLLRVNGKLSFKKDNRTARPEEPHSFLAASRSLP
jgi:hypothetical protein